MNVAVKIWQKIAPQKILLFIRFLLEPTHYKLKRKRVLKFYDSKKLRSEPKEIEEGVKFLKFHKYTALPYKWTLKYENYIPEVFLDSVCNRFYILFLGKKLYFPKSFTKTKAIWGTRSILKEQDAQSPHLYLTENFNIEDGSIIIDGGVAEGNFALSVVEKAKRLYLIECDPEWIDTLKLTFAPWKNKVVFVSKYLSGTDSENSVTIDSLISPEENEKYFIKLDIEGYEKDALSGMKNLVSVAKDIKMDICTYHNKNDLNDIQNIIKQFGFKWEVSNGYLLYFQEGDEPEFRKALIRARKV